MTDESCAASRDAELARRAARGDAEAFAELMGRHRERLHALCRRITCHDEDAQDALQNAMIRAWEQLGEFEERSTPGTWLYRITTNCAVDEVRRRGRTALPTETIPERVGAQGVDRAVEARVDVDRALARIPPDFRAVVVLRELCDLTYLEIAAVRGIPVDTVKSQLSRGRQALVGLLRERALARM